MSSQEGPKVSVLMPAYNAEAYIEESILSIQQQTLRDFELIILDDCSTDGTWDIMQSLSAKDSRIIVRRNAENLGIAGNRNKLLKLGRAAFIAWQDADDISYPYRLQEQYDYLVSHGDVGIVGGYLEFFNASGTLSLRKYPEKDKELRRMIFKVSPVAQPGAMARKDIVVQVGGFDESYKTAEDLELLFRIGKISKLANLQKPVIRYRQTPSSSTFKGLKEMERNSIALRRKYSVMPEYDYRLDDKAFLAVQQLTLELLPVHLRVKLFDLIRNSKG